MKNNKNKVQRLVIKYNPFEGLHELHRQFYDYSDKLYPLQRHNVEHVHADRDVCVAHALKHFPELAKKTIF